MHLRLFAFGGAIFAVGAACLPPIPPPPPPPPPIGVSLAAHNGNWGAAFLAAIANGTNIVLVPAGTWPSPQIIPPKGMTIKGEGSATTFVVRNARGPTTGNNGGIFKVLAAGVTISDLTIRGWPITVSKSDDVGVQGINATGLKVQRVNIENMQGIGIQTEGTVMNGCLVEDVNITNTLVRENGAHGVALWPYNGTVNCTFRRIGIDGAVVGGILLDAGTTGSTDAKSVDGNVFEDITIKNVSSIGSLGAIMMTGACDNSFTNISINGVVKGPAFTFGVDQSGLTTTRNVVKNVTLPSIPSGDIAWYDSRVCNNSITGVIGGPWKEIDPGNCNIYTP